MSSDEEFVDAVEDGKWDITALLNAEKEWRKTAVFDNKGVFIGGNYHPSEDELQLYVNAWEKHDATIGSGLHVDGVHYDVHRVYGDLIFGRHLDKDNAEETQGVALSNSVVSLTKRVVHVLIVYEYPCVSAKAASRLRKFCREHIEPSNL